MDKTSNEARELIDIYIEADPRYDNTDREEFAEELVRWKKEDYFGEVINKVKEFQLAFDSPINETPKLLSMERADLRYELMQEENLEYLLAHENRDLKEVADALGDKLYILIGTILENGMQYKIGEVFDEIHKSNMSKLGKDGKPIINGQNGTDPTRPKGKVLKGPNYFKPDIEAILDMDKVVGRGEN